jgi:hypothetical protein
MKTHTCPTCGIVDECDIITITLGEPQHHSCRMCGTTWRNDGIVIAGSGEPK